MNTSREIMKGYLDWPENQFYTYTLEGTTGSRKETVFPSPSQSSLHLEGGKGKTAPIKEEWLWQTSTQIGSRTVKSFPALTLTFLPSSNKTFVPLHHVRVTYIESLPNQHWLTAYFLGHQNIPLLVFIRHCLWLFLQDMEWSGHFTAS